MDPEVLSEARDFVTGWIDKAGADGNGINMEVSWTTRSKKLAVTDGLQGNQRRDGQTIRSLLALRHGRRFLLRGYSPSQVNPVHVLRGQGSRAAVQVLINSNYNQTTY